MLKKNMGSLDRILRAVVGLALLAGFFLLPGRQLSQLAAAGDHPAGHVADKQLPGLYIAGHRYLPDKRL